MATITRKPASIIVDKPFRSANGFLMFFIGVVLLLAPLWGFLSPIFNMFFGDGDTTTVIRGVSFTRLLSTPLLVVLGVFILKGLYTVQPNQAVVLLLFGDYKGTDRSAGLRWVNPFLSKTRVSERAQNLKTVTQLKSRRLSFGALVTPRKPP
jgi:hypothetical protein